MCTPAHGLAHMVSAFVFDGVCLKCIQREWLCLGLPRSLHFPLVCTISVINNPILTHTGTGWLAGLHCIQCGFGASCHLLQGQGN